MGHIILDQHKTTVVQSLLNINHAAAKSHTIHTNHSGVVDNAQNLMGAKLNQFIAVL